MTQHEQDRFFAILAKADDLLKRFDSVRQECRLPNAASQAARGASFKAQLQLGVVVANVTAALYSMRKGQGSQPPAIDPERDAMVFDEFVSGYAGAQGLRCRVVADAFMSAAEVLLSGAEAAAQSAELLVRSDERTLTAFAVAIDQAACPPAPFVGILAGSGADDLHAALTTETAPATTG